LAALELEPKIKWQRECGGVATGRKRRQGSTQNTSLNLPSEITPTTAIVQAWLARPGFRRICTLVNQSAAGLQGLERHAELRDIKTWRSSQFLAEVGWREFAHHLLYHFPTRPPEPLRADFKKFPWREDGAFLKAWQKGQTGYPIVTRDARAVRPAGCTIVCG